MNCNMNRLVVRTLSKERLRITINLPSKAKNFERSSDEAFGGFVKRLKSKLPGEVKTVAIINSSGSFIKDNVELCDAFISSNKFVLNEVCYDISVDPPTIEELMISNTPVAGLVLAPKVKVINIAITNLMYKWETKATDGNWEEISSAGVLLLYPKLMGKLVRLCCFGPGVEPVFSNVIGPVIDDVFTNSLLSRAISMEYGFTRIMSYNILADAFMESRTDPIRNFYPYCPKKFQMRKYREPRIVAEVWAHKPHIICMQEVEDKTFSNCLLPMLEKYHGHITVIKGRFKAGCAMFFKADDFEECHYESFPLPDLYRESFGIEDLHKLGQKISSKFPDIWKDIGIRPVMTQIAVLRHKESEKLLIVGNTHLFWNPVYHVIALLHIHAMCTKIQGVKDVYEKQGERVSVVICGDMNSQIGSLVHFYLTDGTVLQYQKNKGELFDFLKENVRNPIKLQLARGEPNYTNYTADFKDVIDYVLCDENSTVGQVTPSPHLSDLEKSEGCPSAIFPSDHLPIISDVLLGGRSI
ncbi:hypothetical protein ACHWQZ_G002887 [Mnemiopsis leidyi]